MEALRLLANDHQQTDRLLKQLLAAREKAEQRWLFIEIKHKLEAHARIEEEIFYPALRAKQGRDSRIDESMTDHKAVRSLLLQMEQATPGSNQWLDRLKELKSKVERHVHEEENELFPRARSTLTPDLQEALFERMLVRKAELAGENADSALRSARSAKAGQAASAEHPASAEYATSAQHATNVQHATGAEHATSRTSEQAHEYSRRLGEEGEAALEQGAGAAAEQTRRVADALQATSENLAKEDQTGLSQYLREAANGLNRFSNRLTHGDIEGLLQEARDTAKRNPALVLGGAIAAGFLLTRFVKSTETSSPKTASDEVRGGAEAPYRVPTEPTSTRTAVPVGTSAQPSSPRPPEVR